MIDCIVVRKLAYNDQISMSSWYRTLYHHFFTRTKTCLTVEKWFDINTSGTRVFGNKFNMFTVLDSTWSRKLASTTSPRIAIESRKYVVTTYLNVKYLDKNIKAYFRFVKWKVFYVYNFGLFIPSSVYLKPTNRTFEHSY